MKIFFISIAFFWGLGVSAQEKAIAKVHYLFKHINDTTNRDQPIRDEVVLYLGNNSSFYGTNSENRAKESIDAQKGVSDYAGHLVLNVNTTPIKHAYIISARDKQMIDIESISSSFDAYARDIPYESPYWNLHEDTKLIGGYLCQKATTTFKGRNYIAWFTTELPFQSGPWKLHGLPGLILAANDEKNEVSFEYAGFDFMGPREIIEIGIPFYVLSASKQDIEQQKQVFETDPNSYFGLLNSSGRMATSNSFYGIDYSVDAIDFKFDDDYKPSFKTNNPIEIVN